MITALQIVRIIIANPEKLISGRFTSHLASNNEKNCVIAYNFRGRSDGHD